MYVSPTTDHIKTRNLKEGYNIHISNSLYTYEKYKSIKSTTVIYIYEQINTHQHRVYNRTRSPNFWF